MDINSNISKSDLSCSRLKHLIKHEMCQWQNIQISQHRSKSSIVFYIFLLYAFSQITLEIRKEEDYRVPIWIIIGSTLGGLLLLSLLILALWKVMCPTFISTHRLTDSLQTDRYIHTYIHTLYA